ncbi:MAG TPA: carbon storage regulator [Pirellulales bacterium]
MLVLSRKSKQRIQVGENIVITILQVRGQTVRVGIEAPGDVRVMRSEIADNTVETADETPAGKSSLPRPERMDAGRGEDDPGFSSPLLSCATVVGEAIVGESAGLYPFVRRRAMRQPATTAGLLAARD